MHTYTNTILFGSLEVVLFCSLWKSYFFALYGSRTFLLSMKSYFFSLYGSRTFLPSMEVEPFWLCQRDGSRTFFLLAFLFFALSLIFPSQSHFFPLSGAFSLSVGFFTSQWYFLDLFVLYGRCLLIEMYFCKGYNYGEKVDLSKGLLESKKCVGNHAFFECMAISFQIEA